MSSHPVLDLKKPEELSKIPVKRILNPKALITSSHIEPLDSLAEAKICFNTCINPVKQDHEVFEKCLVNCSVKFSKIHEFMRTNDYMNALMKPHEKKKK